MPKPYKPLPLDAEFELFYAAYPRKQNRGDARKAWDQTQPIRPSTEDIVKAVVRQKGSEKWREDDGAYIPYPASWLRGERWEDVEKIDVAPALSLVPDGAITCQTCGTRTRQYTGRQCNPCWRGVVNPRVAA